MITMTWGAASDTGAVRAVNEDALVAQPPVFLVADGMGGHAGGDVASATVAAAFRPLAGKPFTSRDEVLRVIRDANDEILRLAEGSSELHGMGTTVVGLAVIADDVRPGFGAFNVGDSRLYQLSGGVCRQVTHDHSLVQELVDAGAPPGSPELSAVRHVLTRALGTDREADVDWFPLDAALGDRFLLCSDGLVGEVPVDVIADVLAMARPPVQTARALVRAATAAGGRDNVTALVVDVIQVGAPDTVLPLEAETVPRDRRGRA